MKQGLYCAGSGQREEIFRKITESLPAHSEIAFAYLYGSFLEFARFHDIDVGVYVRDSSLGTVQDLDLWLSGKLSKKLGYAVEVQLLNEAPVSFLYHVFRGRLIFCRDEELLAEVVERTLHRYFDMAPLLRRATREAFAG